MKFDYNEYRKYRIAKRYEDGMMILKAMGYLFAASVVCAILAELGVL